MRADAAVEVGGLQTDWTRTRLLGLLPVMGTFSQPQRVEEEGRQQRVVNSIV